jgi:23S rRNA U2552 (ribose-2'-O)-methylase RlmE/FtsJ
MNVDREFRNDLEHYFFTNSGNVITKWHHYFEIYEYHLSRFRGTSATIVEIGVYQGGSLQMWREYFGPDVRLVGVDVNPECSQFADSKTEIIIGDQGDREFLTKLREQVKGIDVVIDDGGHFMEQQIVSFEELFPAVRNGGVYLCEDLHTSYWPSYGGGTKRPGTFIEFGKELVDVMNAWYQGGTNGVSSDVPERTRMLKSLHFYPSMLVVEKETVSPPEVSETGTMRPVQDYGAPPAKYAKGALRRRVRRVLARALRRSER